VLLIGVLVFPIEVAVADGVTEWRWCKKRLRCL
jgi:hypothetical protein